MFELRYQNQGDWNKNYMARNLNLTIDLRNK